MTVKLVFDQTVVDEYADVYFSQHPRARKKPIENPWQETVNTWARMKRPQMNFVKQKWGDFVLWYCTNNNLCNLCLSSYSITQTVYFRTNHRHDPDNTVPKFILDGLVKSKTIIDDDCNHLQQLVLKCAVDKTHPRTEILIEGVINDNDM